MFSLAPDIIGAGEDIVDSAIREVKEEIGLCYYEKGI